MTWNLMVGKNFLWVADQHGHAPEVMLTTYAKWQRGATDADIEQIRLSMGLTPTGTQAPPMPSALAESSSSTTPLPRLRSWPEVILGKRRYLKRSRRSGYRGHMRLRFRHE